MYHVLTGLYAIPRQLSAMNWPEWLQPHVDAFVLWVNGVLEYWDLEYMEYLLWLFLPIIVAFLLPVFLLFFIYGCVIFLHIYGLRHQIREAYASSYWDGARMAIASFWDGVGYLWHGYDVTGLDNIPETGPALFVAYHGTLPIDIYYLIARVMLHKKRILHVVGDKFVFKIPGWGKICKVFCITPGTVEDCIANLKAGNLLIIAPGGVREALFSNPVNYQIMWGKRLGFAKVILGADVPVVPVFTENCRDAFRTPRWGRRLFRRFYERTRLPICPIYGGFPVRMCTHLGKPITFLSDSNPEHVKQIVKEKVHDLIQQHQRLPGSIFVGMWQRFKRKDLTKHNKKDAESISADDEPEPQEFTGRECSTNDLPSVANENLILPSHQRDEQNEPFSAATTATFGGPRQMPEDEEEDDEDDFRFNGDPKAAAAQPLVRNKSSLSRNSSTRSTSSNNRAPVSTRRSSSNASANPPPPSNDRPKPSES